MKLREVIGKGSEILFNAGIENAANDARMLAMHVFELSYSDILLNADMVCDEAKLKEYMECIRKRERHYPCQYIIGSVAFLGYNIVVRENVLIPRQETEILVEKAVEYTDGLEAVAALDMCCGTGCIGIGYSLMREKKLRKTSLVLADISDYACELAAYNRDRLAVEGTVIKSDLFSNIEGKYDIILSNPPYIKSADIEGLMLEVKEYEPMLALDGFLDGLFFYRRIIDEAGKYLNAKGRIIFEIGCEQFEAVSSLLADAGFTAIELIKDYAQLDRIVTAVWDKEK